MLEVRRAARLVPLCAAVAAMVLAYSACAPRNPPNALTAMLRAIPWQAAIPATKDAVGNPHSRGDEALYMRLQGLWYYFTDYNQFRKQTGRESFREISDLPEPLRIPLLFLQSTPAERLLSDNVLDLAGIEAAIVVGNTEGPVVAMLVGSFDRKRASSVLAGQGAKSEESGLFELYSEEEAGATGVGPRRLVASPSYEAAKAVTSFRGGENSLLGLPLSQDLSLAVGRPPVVHATFLAGNAGRVGTKRPDGFPCHDIFWATTVLRYSRQQRLEAAAAVFQFRDDVSASAAKGSVEQRLGEELERLEARIEVSDTRRNRLVILIGFDEKSAAFVESTTSERSWLAAKFACPAPIPEDS